jgi:exopolysaccharide production protein ExoZ
MDDFLRRPQLDSIQALRAIAALLVILFHTQSLALRVDSRPPFSGIFGEGGAVDVFFVLSGFIMTWVHAADWGKPHRAANYLFNRVRRIYPSVWIVTILAIVIYALGFGGAEKAGKLTLWNAVATSLLLPQNETSLVNVTWTLKYEIFFYLVFLLTILERRWGFIALGLWQAAIVVVALAHVPYQDLWFGFYLRPICLAFGIGVVCAQILMGKRRVTFGAPAAQWGVLLAGILVFVAGMVYESHSVGHAAKLPDVVYGLSAGAILTSLVLLESAGRIRVHGWLVKMGGASYAIYLVHFAIISLLVTVAAKIQRVPLNDVECLLFVATAIAAGAYFDQFVDQPIQARLVQMKQRASSPSPVNA